MRIEISTSGFQTIIVVVVAAVIVSLFLTLEMRIFIILGVVTTLLISFYIKRNSVINEFCGKEDYTINFAVTAIIIGGFNYFFRGKDLEVLITTSLVVASIITLGYVLKSFNIANKDANTSKLWKVNEWDVYSEKQTEVPTLIDGNVVVEYQVVNQVATKLSYDEAVLLLKKLYFEGNEPHAVSSKQYGVLAPKMDHNGQFIGFQYNNANENMPFKID
ncbi:hypothetical protein BAE46_00705 [Glaciecola punicea]|uniref:hypothetical protein n=1 Tax=Glaciecola punicea TaxID=56804 RepID=UPI0008726CEB|nr:hypothetical protein [Glaciecola punicea]OFA33264.1 hypothetical protein BAE46_00705 [Glaciecola punicea]